MQAEEPITVEVLRRTSSPNQQQQQQPQKPQQLQDSSEFSSKRSSVHIPEQQSSNTIAVQTDVALGTRDISSFADDDEDAILDDEMAEDVVVDLLVPDLDYEVS